MNSIVLRLMVAAALLAPAALAQNTSPNLIASGQEFVALLAKKDFAGAVAHFDATMKLAMPEAKLKETWRALETQVGPFQRQLRARGDKLLGYDLVFIACQFERSALAVKVVFDPQRRVAGLFFVPAAAADAAGTPPPYARSESFLEKAVTVGTGEWALPGTLTVPRGSGPWPAVVLVHGSGPEDRDETIGPNKPFRDLAWGLASRGIAVLRYEKRTKEYSAKLAASASKITVEEETISDARDAIRLLREAASIDPKQIYLIGHSLGGLVAPRLGRSEPALAGLIIMAGSTRPLEDLIVEQTRYIISLNGPPSEGAKTALAELQAKVARIKKLTPADADSAELVLGAGARYWLDLRAYDPVATARKLEQRLLILQGGRDYQVTEADFAGWTNGLASTKTARFKLYPKLNHLFIAGEGKSTPAEYDQAGHVDESVVTDVAEWIKAPAGSR